MAEPILRLTGLRKSYGALTVTDGRAKLRGLWLGLTGPMGALPTHLTEFAFYERRYAKTQPFGDFLDLLAGRMLQLFYRVWADSQPTAQADRPDDDRRLPGPRPGRTRRSRRRAWSPARAGRPRRGG